MNPKTGVTIPALNATTCFTDDDPFVADKPNIINMQITPINSITAAVAITALTRPSWTSPPRMSPGSARRTGRPVVMDSISAANMNWTTRSAKREDSGARGRGDVSCPTRSMRARLARRSSMGHLRPRVPRSVDAVLRVGAVTPVEEKHATRVLK